MKHCALVFLAVSALSQTAGADYLEASRAEATRQTQQWKAEKAESYRRDEAARERVYASLSDSFASAHGGYVGETKRFGSNQPLAEVVVPQLGSLQARLILSFSTGDRSECGVFLSFYQDNNGYRNSVILDCVNPTTGKSARKNVVLKNIAPTII